MNKRLLDRFFSYIKIDTQSNEESGTVPSTKKQFDLSNKLQTELVELGLKDALVDDKCYLMATLPANCDENYPVIGFMAHMDTATDITGANVKPQIIENYDGKDIVLNKEENIVLSPSNFPEMTDYIGNTLITTDGTTLLGADDKAGIAEIMEALSYLKDHPQYKHGTIKVAFTPDEEIGVGADSFDVKRFGAEFAYTVDGGKTGEIEYENFNAASAKIKIKGLNVHPGNAKNKMLNSILIGQEFNNMLPAAERAEHTENYEGFFLMVKFNGTIEETNFEYIVRDHDFGIFADRKLRLEKISQFLNDKYGNGTVTLTLKDQYFNMKEKIEPVKYIVDLAVEAVKKADIEPIVIPIRGGTDGSKLSYMGLPTPNIFAGPHNLHGRYEYVPVESMEKAVKVILNIISLSKKYV